MRKDKIVSLDDVTFVTLSSNRIVEQKRLVADIKSSGGILNAPIVFRALDFKDDGLEFRDLLTGEPVDSEELTDTTYLVSDGQHRTVGAYIIHKEAEACRNRDVASGHSDVLDIPEIEVRVYDKEELHGHSLIEFITHLNKTSKNWGSRDYIHMTAAERKDDKRILVIKKLDEIGLPLSTINRLLAYDSKALNKQKFADLVSDASDPCTMRILDSLKCGRGLKVLVLFLTKGFHLKFIRKRYLIDYIIRMHRLDKEEDALKMIASLSNEGIKYIEEKSSDELSPDNLEGIIERLTYSYDGNEAEVCPIQIPSDDIDENLTIISNYALSEASAKNKRTKRNAHH